MGNDSGVLPINLGGGTSSGGAVGVSTFVTDVNGHTGSIFLAPTGGASLSISGNTFSFFAPPYPGVSTFVGSFNGQTGAITFGVGASTFISSLNGLTGALSLAAGTNVSLTIASPTITITASGGAAGGASAIMYTPTIQGMGTCSQVCFFYQLNVNMLTIQGFMITGTGDGSLLAWTFPASLSAHASLNAGLYTMCGNYTQNNSTASATDGNVLTKGGHTLFYVARNFNSQDSGMTPKAGNALFNAGNALTFICHVVVN